MAWHSKSDHQLLPCKCVSVGFTALLAWDSPNESPLPLFSPFHAQFAGAGSTLGMWVLLEVVLGGLSHAPQQLLLLVSTSKKPCPGKCNVFPYHKACCKI